MLDSKTLFEKDDEVPLRHVVGVAHHHTPGATDRLYQSVGKRTIDVIGAFVLIVLLLPLFVLIGVIVAIDGGEPIFAHQRVGRGGRRFYCYKFRTMVHGAEAMLPAILRADPKAADEWAADQKISDDPRVTGIGRILRGTSLDELPQLWNVLRGDMSLVGPRPVTEAEMARYGEHARHYLSVRPGLTGLWQVYGRNAITYEDRVALDVDYTRSISFGRDVVILFLTAAAVAQLTGR